MAASLFSPRLIRRGVTLVELLVVIGLIAILVSLLAPAVQQAREGARRTECRNKLRQIGIAMHNYVDAHRVFPLNYGNGPYDDTNTGASWLQMVLHYLDQRNLYDRIRFGAPLADPQNTQVARTVVPVYLCPSDAGNDGLMDGRFNVPGVWGVCNYKACLGSNWDCGTFSPRVSKAGRNANNPDGLDHCNGLICRSGDLIVTTTRMRDVSDGTSQTFALGESVPAWCSHTWWYYFNGSTATCAIPLNYRRVPETGSAGDWHVHLGFKSRHPGVAMFAMVDGSVRFVSDAIDYDVYTSAATIQGGEVTGDF